MPMALGFLRGAVSSPPFVQQLIQTHRRELEHIAIAFQVSARNKIQDRRFLRMVERRSGPDISQNRYLLVGQHWLTPDAWAAVAAHRGTGPHSDR